MYAWSVGLEMFITMTIPISILFSFRIMRHLLHFLKIIFFLKLRNKANDYFNA